MNKILTGGIAIVATVFAVQAASAAQGDLMGMRRSKAPITAKAKTVKGKKAGAHVRASKRGKKPAPAPAPAPSQSEE